MTPQSFQRVRELFAVARDLSAAERSAWLGLHCADDDPSVRVEVESLLDQLQPTNEGFLDAPATPVDVTAANVDAPQEQLGHFRLGNVLGQGGMGVVYEAHQDHPKRTVALKLIRPLFVTPKLLRRFEHEADLLARLDHPGVARVYEFGTVPGRSGTQPFFAMELVRGLPLNEFASSRKLSMRQRLELFVRVCDAVQHAHQKGVIHRDLKPSNILVDETGQPKVLDFGIARAIDSDVQATLQTETGQLLGTLPYMSPEQAAGDVHNVDTRSDVYALGVIAFELLAERMPYSLVGKSVPDALHMIRDAEPSRLGTIDRSLGGDVETIVGKALQKDRDRRYASAAGFAADVTNYLNYEPISARRPGTWHQLARFARKNRALVSGVAAVFMVLIAGIVATYLQAKRARAAELIAVAQKQHAVDAFDASVAVRDFFTDTLGAASPEEAQGDEITVRQQLDRAAMLVGERFRGKPLAESEVRGTIGRVYVDLGRYKSARAQLTVALTKRREALPNLADDPYATELMNKLVLALHFDGEHDEAITLHREVLLRYRRQLGDDHMQTIESFRSIGGMLVMGKRFAEGLAFARQGMELARKNLGDDHAQTLACQEVIAVASVMTDQAEDAEVAYRDLATRYRRLHGDTHGDTLRAAGGWAVTLHQLNRYAEAETILLEVLKNYRRVFGADHPTTLDIERKLALALSALKRHDEAESLVRHAQERALATLGADNPTTLSVSTNRAWVMHAAGKSDVAEEILKDVLARAGKLSGPDSAQSADAAVQLVRLKLARGDAESALPLAKQLVELSDAGRFDSAAAAGYGSYFGICLLRAKRYSEAEAVLLRSREQLVSADAEKGTRCREVTQGLVEVYEATNRATEAARWRMAQLEFEQTVPTTSPGR